MAAIRHQPLSVDGGETTNFDFLSQRPGFRRRFCAQENLPRNTVISVLVIIAILLIVNLATLASRNDEVVEMDFEKAQCLLPLGGSYAAEGGSIGFPHTGTPLCLSVFLEYFEEDGPYLRDTELAMQAGDNILSTKGNRSQIIIFDIDETALSNVPFLKERKFSSDDESRKTHYIEGDSPPVPAVLEFYKAIRNKGFTVAFITGRREEVRNGTEANLANAGYGTKCARKKPKNGEMCYHKLVLRDANDTRDAVIYKSEARKIIKEEGFEVIASVGDQWSDLLGHDRASTLIKMPNPLYYIP